MVATYNFGSVYTDGNTTADNHVTLESRFRYKTLFDISYQIGIGFEADTRE